MRNGKKSGKKRSHSSIFLIILCINLCSIIVLTAFNYYVFHHKSGKAYLESFLSYNQQVTSLAFRNIDRQIMQSVLKLPQLYFSPIKENAPILLPQKERIADSSQHILALATEMSKIQKNYPYIAGIDIYYEGSDTIVTSFNKIHFPSSQEIMDKYLPWYSAYKQTDQTQGGVWIRGNAYLAEEPVIININRISRPDWNGKDIILAVYINPESFSEYIDQKEGKLAITTGDNHLLYDSGLGELDFIPAKEPGWQRSNNLMMFHDVSPTSGLNYYYGMDSSRFYENYDITSRFFLINFLISIVFNLIMLTLISYYNYKTYQRRVQLLSREAGIPIADSAKSFDSSLHVLTKEIITLHETMDSSMGLLFQSAVRSMILNQEEGVRDKKIAPYLTKQNCCVVLIGLPAADMEAPPVEELQAAYPPGIGNYHVLFAAVEDQELAAVLLFDQGNWEGVRDSFIADMEKRWKKYWLVSGQIFPVEKEGIKNSYQSAIEAARYRYIFTGEKYLSYEQIKISERKESGSHLKLFETVRRDINNENLLDLKSHVTMLVTSFESGNYTIAYCQSTLRDFITLLYQTIQQNQLDMWVVFGYDIRDYYKKISDIHVFHSWCDSLCEVILEAIHQKKQSVDGDMHSLILKLVEEHLENDISLDLLADKLQIRSDVASRLFSQIMGSGYTEYIKSRKLERARQLLAEGLSVKDTAEKLGYSSAQYFIKVFKEDCAMTPYQYKKNLEKEKH